LKEKDGFIEGQINIEDFDKFRSQEARRGTLTHVFLQLFEKLQKTWRSCRFLINLQKGAHFSANF
jgi:hypothetical protein